MTTLLQLCPGDRYLAWMVGVLLQATTVLTIAWVLASFLACHNAAARYATWLVALTLLVLTPLTGYLAVSSELSLIELSLPREYVDEGPTALAAVQPSASTAPAENSSSPIAFPRDEEFSNQSTLGEPGVAFPDQPTVALTPSVPPMWSAPVPAFSAGESPPPSSAPSRPLIDYLRAGSLIVSVIWVSGIGCLAMRLAWRARQLSSLLRKTQPLENPEIIHIVQEICRGMGLRRIPELRIWESPGANLAPVTVGAFRPQIVLSPTLFGSLSKERLRDALVHECADVLRRDVLVALIQRVAVIGFWPHPLVWLMDRGLSRAREEVCDNYVLRDSDGASYAETLLDVCQGLEPSAMNGAQLGLFERPWRLEQRIAGLLDGNRVLLTRIRPARALVLCVVLLTAVTLSGGVRLLIADPAVPGELAGVSQSSETTTPLSNTDDPATHDQNLVTTLGLRPAQSLEDGRINAVSLEQCKLTLDLVQQLKGLSALNGLSLTMDNASDIDLALLRELPTIEMLWLSGQHITPAGVSHLRQLAKLKQLHLDGPDVTDSSLELLSGLPQLESLGFSGTDVTPTGLGNLKRLPRLKSVMFQRNAPDQNRPGTCVITDVELQMLAEIPTLTAISLGRGCEVTDQGMAFLGKLSQLEELKIHGGNITDTGLAQLKLCPRLKKLYLSECRWFTDEGLAHLRGLTELQELELSRGEFTDAGMAHLEPLRNLETLNLSHAQLSEQGLAHLRRW